MFYLFEPLLTSPRHLPHDALECGINSDPKLEVNDTNIIADFLHKCELPDQRKLIQNKYFKQGSVARQYRMILLKCHGNGL